jgi:hypothetical protein
MAYAGEFGEHCVMSMDNGADHVHMCEFTAEHTDWEYDGSHQCQCGEIW